MIHCGMLFKAFPRFCHKLACVVTLGAVVVVLVLLFAVVSAAKSANGKTTHSKKTINIAFFI
jgi:cytochrome bd-type quinol oxidase subunit 2